MTDIEKIQIRVDSLILKTPTGKIRNELTEINMLLIMAIDRQDNKNLIGKDKPYHH